MQWTRRFAGLALVLALSGCHETLDAAEPTTEAEGDPAERDRLPPLESQRLIPSTQLAVARTLKFARIDDGVSVGFDLDDRVSPRGDRETCGRTDHVSPDGVEGIDNGLADVLPIIERVGGSALEDLVQAAINEGDLLVMLEMHGIDSLEADDDIELTMMRGLGLPYVGTDDRIEPWQTYDVDMEAPWSRASGTLVDGVLEAGPVEFDLPIYVFDFEFLVRVQQGRLRIELDEEGPIRAVVGGIVLMENLLDIANNIEGGQNIAPTLDTIGRTFADMLQQEDGTCAGISVALELDLAGAFFYDDTERPDR